MVVAVGEAYVGEVCRYQGDFEAAYDAELVNLFDDSPSSFVEGIVSPPVVLDVLDLNLALSASFVPLLVFDHFRVEFS